MPLSDECGIDVAARFLRRISCVAPVAQNTMSSQERRSYLEIRDDIRLFSFDLLSLILGVSVQARCEV